ncbi:MAG: type II secretion system protein [Candidatus Aminicenantes bacterium]|nr:type II secretion system protein [Candidatus Aminicenantes bacterium]
MVRHPKPGYTLIVVMVGIALLLVGMTIAMPVLSTQAQREKEAELLFRGGQYVEAVRLFLRNNPGNFPDSIDDLVKKRYLRKAFPDPMTKDGKWNLILLANQPGGPAAPRRKPPTGRSGAGSARREAPGPGARAGQSMSVQRVMIVPADALDSVAGPRIIGVVSASEKQSFLVYDDNETYDSWLFYYGRTKGAKPEIIRFGEDRKK